MKQRELWDDPPPSSRFLLTSRVEMQLNSSLLDNITERSARPDLFADT